MFQPADPDVVLLIRYHLRKRREDEAERRRARFQECQALALDETPLDAGERLRDERNVSYRGNGA